MSLTNWLEDVGTMELTESEKWLMALTFKIMKIWWFGFTLVWLIDTCIGLINGLMELWLQWEIRKYKMLFIWLGGTWMKIKTHTWLEDKLVLYKNYTKNNNE